MPRNVQRKVQYVSFLTSPQRYLWWSKIHKQQIWKRSNYQEEKKLSAKSLQTVNERNATVLTSVKYFSSELIFLILDFIQYLFSLKNLRWHIQAAYYQKNNWIEKVDNTDRRKMLSIS